MVVDASVLVSHLVPSERRHEASRRWIAARLRIRGADAVYIAAAAQLHLPLVTWDVEQRDRAARVVEVLVPES